MIRQTVELRLTGVPQDVYLALLKAKAQEEQRLRRRCNLTDALKLIVRGQQQGDPLLQVMADGTKREVGEKEVRNG